MPFYLLARLLTRLCVGSCTRRSNFGLSRGGRIPLASFPLASKTRIRPDMFDSTSVSILTPFPSRHSTPVHMSSSLTLDHRSPVNFVILSSLLDDWRRRSHRLSGRTPKRARVASTASFSLIVDRRINVLIITHTHGQDGLIIIETSMIGALNVEKPPATEGGFDRHHRRVILRVGLLRQQVSRSLLTSVETSWMLRVTIVNVVSYHPRHCRLGLSTSEKSRRREEVSTGAIV